MKLIVVGCPYPSTIKPILVHQLSLFIVPFFCVSGLAFRWSSRVPHLHLPRCYGDTWDCCKICKVRCPPLLFCMLTWLARSYREWSQEKWNWNHVNSLRFRRCGGGSSHSYTLSEVRNPSMRFCILSWYARDRRAERESNRVSSLRFSRCGASCCSVCASSYRPLPICTNFQIKTSSIRRLRAYMCANSLRSPIDSRRCSRAWRWPQPSKSCSWF